MCCVQLYIYRGTSPKIVPTRCARFAHLTFDIFCKSSQFGQFTFLLYIQRSMHINVVDIDNVDKVDNVDNVGTVNETL